MIFNFQHYNGIFVIPESVKICLQARQSHESRNLHNIPQKNFFISLKFFSFLLITQKLEKRGETEKKEFVQVEVKLQQLQVSFLCT